MYVNTTNTKLDLTQGAVAQTLAKAAGPSLQAECTRKAPVSLGNIAVTRAGNLPSQYILHVVAPSYDGPGGQAEKVTFYHMSIVYVYLINKHFFCIDFTNLDPEMHERVQQIEGKFNCFSSSWSW